MTHRTWMPTGIALVVLLTISCTDAESDITDIDAEHPHDTGTDTGNGSGNGTDTGNGSGNGTDTGNGSGTDSGNGSGTDSGIDTDTGNGIDTGLDTSSTVAVTVHRVATWRGDATAAYAIIHDDLCDYSTQGLETHWQELTDRGLRAGFGAIVQSCESRNLYTLLSQMMNAGHEIINHSWSHPDVTTSGVNLDAEIRDAGTTLATRLGRPITYFIFPFDSFNDTVLTYLQSNGYLSARGGNRGVDSATLNTADPLAPFRARFDCYNENRGAGEGNCSVYSSNGMRQYLDDIIAAGGSGIRELHNIGPTGWGNITLPQYTTHLDYVVTRIQAGQLWMDTPTEVMKYRVSRAVCGAPVHHDGVITFAQATDATCQLYATPLSVIVTAPAGVSITAVQNGAAIDVQPIATDQYIVHIHPTNGQAHILQI